MPGIDSEGHGSTVCADQHVSPMGKHRKPDQSAAQPSNADHSPAQGVVELLRAAGGGLVFWSRHRLEIAVELKMLLHRSVMKRLKITAKTAWAHVHGFVVECKPARRGDGTIGFEVSIVFETWVTGALDAKKWLGRLLPGQMTRRRKGSHFGLN